MARVEPHRVPVSGGLQRRDVNGLRALKAILAITPPGHGGPDANLCLVVKQTSVSASELEEKRVEPRCRRAGTLTPRPPQPAALCAEPPRRDYFSREVDTRLTLTAL